MDQLKNNPFFDFNWRNFEEFFGGKLPVPPVGKGDSASWIEEYVQNVLKQALPTVNLATVKQRTYHTELFDTHNNVIVKVHIPDKTQARKVRVMLSSNQIRLEGTPDDTAQTIRLSSLVVPSSCKAVYRNGVLQLHMRKLVNDNLFHEVDVRFP